MFFLLICSNSNANILDTTPNTGIKILNPGVNHGAGVSIARAANEDPRYPYWESYCDAYSERSGDALCWPSNIKNTSVFPKGTSKLKITLYMENGYGDTKGTVYIGAGRVYTTALHAFDNKTSRHYRLDFYADVLSIDSSGCSRAPKKTNVLNNDPNVKASYILAPTERWSTCTLYVSLNPEANDPRMTVRFNSLQVRYNQYIYNDLPAGDWVIKSSWADKMDLFAYDNVGGQIFQQNLFDSVDIKFNLLLSGFFLVLPATPAQQEISFNPAIDKQKAFIANMRIDTNASEYNVSIECQYQLDERCALKNQEGVLLPLDIGLRYDFLGGPVYNEYLLINTLYHFSPSAKRSDDMGFSFLLSKKDVLQVQDVLISKRFEGSATIIFEPTY